SARQVIDALDPVARQRDQVGRLGIEGGDPADVVHLGVLELPGAVDGGVRGVALGDAQLPVALEDHADVLDRGAAVGVVDRDVLDVVRVDGGVLAAERVIDPAGTAGAHGQVGDEVSVTATATTVAAAAAVITAAGGQESQSRCR